MKTLLGLSLGLALGLGLGVQGVAHAGNIPPVPSSWVLGELAQDSIATKAQILILQCLVIDEIRSGRPDEDSLATLNAKLLSLELSPVNANPKIEIITSDGFMGAIEGATIYDGANRYCLPCKAGWNRYELGITRVSK